MYYKMTKSKLFISSLFVFFISVASLSAQVSVRASIDSTDIKIGEQAQIRLDIVSSTDEEFVFPTLKQGDELVKGLEILAISEVQNSTDNGKFKKLRDYLVTAFDSGAYVIPPFILTKKDSSKFQSNELSLNVHTIAEPLKDGEFKDIQPNYEPSLDWVKILLTILGIIVGLAPTVFVIYYSIKNRGKGNEKFIPDHAANQNVIRLTPTEQALKELERIKEEKIWKKGQEKEYYTQITDVLRIYLNERFEIATLERTSSEILESLRFIEDADPVRDKLRQIFSVSDMVKFAKVNPTNDENELSIVNAFFVVKQTVVPERVTNAAEKEQTSSSVEKD